MSDPPRTLVNLPLEILLLITRYLSAADFFSFCSCSPAFYNNRELRYSSSYWSKLIRSTFRVPNQPVVENDGKRWMQLYKRMHTQTKVFAWGHNDGGCLGGETRIQGHFVRPGRPPPRAAMLMTPEPLKASWPRETRLGRNIGIISDFQCGGWSCTALNSRGSLFTIGIMDGLGFGQVPSPVPHRLEYPPGFPSPEDRYDSYTAIKQFSSGRYHVLALSDSGRIWSWDDTHRPGLHVKFLSITLVEGDEAVKIQAQGTVISVVAGWDKSTAHITGTGLVVWTPSNNSEIQGQSDQSLADGMLVLEAWIIPDTGFKRRRSYSIGEDAAKDEERLEHIGEVVKHAVLERFVIFVTDLGKVFACILPGPNEELVRTFRITPTDRDRGRLPIDDVDFVVDIQGSFRTFAFFKRNGEVLIGHQDYLESLWISVADQENPDQSGRTASNQLLRKIPALQQSGVISLAFGDWHFHALHANGMITSYGMEKDFCGSLALGAHGTEAIRGVEPVGWGRGGEPVRPCYSSGRMVCFEQEKKLWLEHIRLGNKDRAEAENRVLQFSRNTNVRAEVSEWVEQRLRGWEEDAKAFDRSHEMSIDHDEADDDELAPYFALSVAAAGWHSGALVLVNEKAAQRTRDRYIMKPRDIREDALVAPGEPSTGGIADRTSNALGSIGRWFLGLPAAASDTSNEPRWRWEDETFPRLELTSGEVMSGTVPVSPWRDGPPVFKDIESVPW